MVACLFPGWRDCAGSGVLHGDGGGPRAFLLRTDALGQGKSAFLPSLVTPWAPDCVTVCFPGPRAWWRLAVKSALGCLVSHEPLWSQGAGDVDTPGAVTVALRRDPASVHLDHPGQECDSRKAP